MKEGVEFAKKYGAKVYVTTNIFAHNENIDGLEEYMLGLKEAGIHGIIVADPLLLKHVEKLHLKLKFISVPNNRFRIGKPFNFGKKKVLNVLF